MRVFEGLFQNQTAGRQVKERANRRLVDTSPNAPLLIRIVKEPYRQEVARGRRRKLFDAGMSVRSKFVRARPVVEAREHREGFIQGNPIRALNIHPPPLAAPPSVDEWLASREAR
ncbi:MAG: hypothetical protein AB8H79_16240 [Myxococcota bacterium]